MCNESDTLVLQEKTAALTIRLASAPKGWFREDPESMDSHSINRGSDAVPGHARRGGSYTHFDNSHRLLVALAGANRCVAMEAWLRKIFTKLSQLVDARVRQGVWVRTPSNTVSPEGKKRLRRLDPELRKMVIANVQSKKARTCAMAARGADLNISATSAREAMGLQMVKYLQETSDAFSGCRSIGLAFDGCKLGGEETTLTAAFSGEKQVAAWLPPQVVCCGEHMMRDGRRARPPFDKIFRQTRWCGLGVVWLEKHPFKTPACAPQNTPLKNPAQKGLLKGVFSSPCLKHCQKLKTLLNRS